MSNNDYGQYLKAELREWNLGTFLQNNPACLDTPRNRELLLAGCDFLRVEVNLDNLGLVYSALRQRGDIPLEISSEHRESSKLFTECFPKLRDTAIENIYRLAPTFRLLLQKQDAERILAEKKQREADNADRPAVQGVWISGAYYTDPATIPHASAELAGMTRAAAQALDEIGRRQVQRNETVRRGE